MPYPKTWHRQRDEVSDAIERHMAKRRRLRMIRKIEEITKSKRPGPARVTLRVIRQYLRHERGHI